MLRNDPRVKKTVVRDCEHKVRPSARPRVVRDTDTGASGSHQKSSGSTRKENELGEPTLCSSEVLANLLTDVRNASPPAMLPEELNIDQGKLSSKITKQLNFHFNDKIYRNLIELNANTEELKNQKQKRPTSSTVLVKKDLEPDIEDFCEDVIEPDSPPKIPIIKPKMKPVKPIEDGQLHKLLSTFEIL